MPADSESDDKNVTTTVRCSVPEGVARLIGTTRTAAESAAAIPLYLSVEAPSTPDPGDSGVSQRKTDPIGLGSALLQEIAAFSRPERYDDIDLVGRGGMGVVRRVFDRVLGREAAMKALEGALMSRGADVLRFLEEAQITGQLDHPAVVPVHDFGISHDGGRAYFTMKLVRGDSLGQIISLYHAIGVDGRALERLLGIFIRVCEAVAFAHTRHVVHRDLKPENILVGTHGQVYVMDWGLALVLDGGRPSEALIREEDYIIAGTPAFMSPEQAFGNIAEIDTRTDVFGLGAVLYAILTGRGPFTAASASASLELARACAVKTPETVSTRSIPPELSRIVMKALSARREDRYQNTEELIRDIEGFLRGGGWFATRHFPAGAVIVREGEPAAAAYVITAGRCEVYKSVDGTKLPLRTLEPGDVFGETAVFTSKPRTATVAALEPVTLKVVTRDSLERELDRSPWMGAFVRALAERFREIDEKLSQR
ncbi:MAG: cyclic nucleotide-binding domain-containing protein [Polyangiaceae bacterium]|nr:cyclic nucleotide-binding domain-containing protein [Polyangiaceae bacterium]